MGEDTKSKLMKDAKQTLVSLRHDGKSKNFTFDHYLTKLRTAHEDLDQAPTERSKVHNLLNGFQHPSLLHCKSTINATDRHSEDFEAAAAFLSQEIASIATTNAPLGRSVAAVETDASAENGSLKQMERRLKKAERKLKKAQRKNEHVKSGAHKRNNSNKFSSGNPGAYIPTSEWRKLTEEQKAEARKARQKDGIPTRKVGAIRVIKNTKTTTFKTPIEESKDVSMEDVDKGIKARQSAPERQVPPSVLNAPPPPSNKPKARALSVTQRVETHDKERHLNPLRTVAAGKRQE